MPDIVTYNRESIYSNYYKNYDKIKDSDKIFLFYHNVPTKPKFNLFKLCEYMKDL